MQHKGEIVEQAVRQSGYSITKLASKLGKSRRWMYHVFENQNLTIDLIIAIGKIIHYDFSQDIKELKKYPSEESTPFVSEPKKTYLSQQREIELWKNKYLELLEKYNSLLTDLAQNQKKKPTSKIKK